MNGSWFGKRTVEPTGTTTTCGAYVLSVIAISTVTGLPAVDTLAGASRYSTASLRSGDGLLSFSRITIRPDIPASDISPPTASSMTIPTTRITNLPKLLRPRAWSLL
ncbi:MAG: hypothetical protein DMD66_08550 [Gemmatimonadetes bacterium]|nr:MAG: hypothetical protein DMD66_08550 [Gemmatimonadota bacterium]